MTDHEIPDENSEEPGSDVLGHVLEEAALRTSLAAVPDPPAGELDRALQAALDAFDEVHRGRHEGPDTAVVPVRWRRRGGAVGAVGAHRRLAAVAAVVVALVGVAGVLITRDRPDSTASDLAAAPREASLEQPATTTTPAAGLAGAGTITAREQGNDDAATSDRQADAVAPSRSADARPGGALAAAPGQPLHAARVGELRRRGLARRHRQGRLGRAGGQRGQRKHRRRRRPLARHGGGLRGGRPPQRAVDRRAAARSATPRSAGRGWW